jgi:hypothetical protein
MSRSGDASKSLQWLKRAIALGYSNIAGVKRDPDLVFLQRETPTEFAGCTQVKFKWQMVYGFFNDDIVLTNDSAFALTNVAFDVRLQQDSQTWTPTLKADGILPGEKYTWRNVVSIPGSRITQSSAVIACDQNR